MRSNVKIVVLLILIQLAFSACSSSQQPKTTALPSLIWDLFLFGLTVIVALGFAVVWFYWNSKRSQAKGSSKLYIGGQQRPPGGAEAPGRAGASGIAADPRTLISRILGFRLGRSAGGMNGAGGADAAGGAGAAGGADAAGGSDLQSLQREIAALRGDIRSVKERQEERGANLLQQLTAIDRKLGAFDSVKWSTLFNEVAKTLETLDGAVEVLNRRANRLQPQIDDLRPKIDTILQSIENLKQRKETRSSLEDLLRAEQDLLYSEWHKRFLENRATKEIGELVEHIDDDEGYQVLLELLNALPPALEFDRELSQVLESKLSPVILYNQQLKRLGLVKKRAEEELPKDPEQQKQKLLLIRDSFHLLANLQSTDAGARVLRFKPSKWCAEEFPEIADLFLQAYQRIQDEGDETSLEEARTVVYKALRLGNLKPIEIVLGQTPFDSTMHVGKAFASDPGLPNGTIVGVIKNGFCSLRDGRAVIQPEVEVNRI